MKLWNFKLSGKSCHPNIYVLSPIYNIVSVCKGVLLNWFIPRIQNGIIRKYHRYDGSTFSIILKCTFLSKNFCLEDLFGVMSDVVWVSFGGNGCYFGKAETFIAFGKAIATNTRIIHMKAHPTQLDWEKLGTNNWSDISLADHVFRGHSGSFSWQFSSVQPSENLSCGWFEIYKF